MNKLKKEREFLDKCSKLLNGYKHNVFGVVNSEDMLKISNDFYRDLKNVFGTYYSGEEPPYNYRYIAQEIETVEKLLPPEYIMAYQSHDFSRILDAPVSLKNPEVVLDYIVDQTRNYLYDEVAFERSIFPFEAYDLQNKCMDATSEAYYVSTRLGIYAQEMIIYPCFRRNSGVMWGGMHSFLLVLINGKAYLVDCTYSQFFMKKRCNLKRIGIPLLIGVYPGVFMQMDEFRQEVAQTILNRGWIECSEEVIKAYFDGFMLSYRNGLYYERTKDFSFNTKYTAECYEDFIRGLDDLFSYERKEELGYQFRALDNSDMEVSYPKSRV